MNVNWAKPWQLRARRYRSSSALDREALQGKDADETIEHILYLEGVSDLLHPPLPAPSVRYEFLE